MTQGTDSLHRTAAVEAVVGYHARTKHGFNRYARSLGYMDWATQPDPFRRFDGAQLFLLPFSESDTSPAYESLYDDLPEPGAVNVRTIGAFFQHALAISAHKQYGDAAWSLRCNPSSGNLHPTEGYMIAGPIAGLADTPGIYHYAALEHGLERRAEIPPESWQLLVKEFPVGTFFAGLTSIHWRESWKYGERAYRYCQHDAGHALAALTIAAAGLGWRVFLLDGWSDVQLGRAFGVADKESFPDSEQEEPESIVAVLTQDQDAAVPLAPSNAQIDALRDITWHGTPNRLSSEHVTWEVIGDVAAAAAKPQTNTGRYEYPEPGEAAASGHDCPLSTWQITTQRRSAVAMDGRTGITRHAFYTMLERTMPRPCRMPWYAWPYEPVVHLGLFVHLVEGITPGVYMLVRNPQHLDTLKSETKKQFEWVMPEGCPENLPLYLLGAGDCRRLAAQVSCNQEIAGLGAFSLGMIAQFRPSIERYGAWYYRRLHWEAGMIGQILYLEAEAAGIRSTGIGCYFDDPVHQVFGFSNDAFQSMYHFTVGGAVEDTRLTTKPPYTDKRRARPGWVEGG